MRIEALEAINPCFMRVLSLLVVLTCWGSHQEDDLESKLTSERL